MLALFFFPLSRAVCFLSLPETDCTLSRVPEMSDEEEEDILEKPLTEFYDSSFEILSKIVLFKFLSLSLLSSVTTLFSVKEI